jgi:hypothetical protein
VLRAALARARMRLLLLGNGHGRRRRVADGSELRTALGRGARISTAQAVPGDFTAICAVNAPGTADRAGSRRSPTQRS